MCILHESLPSTENRLNDFDQKGVFFGSIGFDQRFTFKEALIVFVKIPVNPQEESFVRKSWTTPIHSSIWDKSEELEGIHSNFGVRGAMEQKVHLRNLRVGRDSCRMRRSGF